jgi:hypothetical protein
MRIFNWGSSTPLQGALAGVPVANGCWVLITSCPKGHQVSGSHQTPEVMARSGKNRATEV